MTPSIDQTLHLFANLLPNWTLIPILTLLSNFGGFHRTLQRVRLANRGRLLLRTPGPVPFGTCICSNVETILSWTCHFYGPFEFRTSLSTSIMLTIKATCNAVNTGIVWFKIYLISSVIKLLYICSQAVLILARSKIGYLKTFKYCKFTAVYTSLKCCNTFHFLAKDHWWGFSTRNAHIVHIVSLIRLKMVFTSWKKSLFILAHEHLCRCVFKLFWKLNFSLNVFSIRFNVFH